MCVERCQDGIGDDEIRQHGRAGAQADGMAADEIWTFEMERQGDMGSWL